MNQEELKQRLIELIDGMPWRIEQDFSGVRISNGSECSDYLIANGVTIRERGEWIPVTERLPKTDARVLVYMHENRTSYTRIDTDRVVQGKWVRWETCVTHWMPLPLPPETEKGGE